MADKIRTNSSSLATATTGSPNLKVSDVMCPICLCILVEPVTMPCSHSLCMPCFTQHVSQTSLACPLCRMRISVWVRRSTKTKQLVNTVLWQTIKAKFPAKVEARLKGEEDSDSEVLFSPVHHVSAPGEIRQEYEAMVAMEQQELLQRKSKEDTASVQLIRKFQDEEGDQLRIHQEQLDLTKDDGVFAQQLREEERLQTQNELKRLQMLCADDEAVAKQIEENERELERQQRLMVSSQQRKSVTPTTGPMDVYLGQQTPRTCGKIPVSRLTQQPFNDKVIETPHSSTSVEPTGEHKLGRQLREITSSQSSESDAEEMILLRHSNKAPSTPGKENRSKKRKVTFSKTENCKIAKSNNLQFSPDIDSYSGGRSVKQNLSSMDEYSDDTDVEESSPAAEMSRKKTMVDKHETEIPDYGAIFVGELNAASLASLVAEQKRIEEKLEQEEKDRLLAEALQSEFNQGKVNRRKGSEDEYALRRRKSLTGSPHGAGPSGVRRAGPKHTIKNSTKGKKKQLTLTDSIAKHCKKV